MTSEHRRKNGSFCWSQQQLGGSDETKRLVCRISAHVVMSDSNATKTHIKSSRDGGRKAVSVAEVYILVSCPHQRRVFTGTYKTQFP